jgi:hypothetical protein
MSQTADLDARSIIGQPVPPLYTSLDKAELGAIHRACESGDPIRTLCEIS